MINIPIKKPTNLNMRKTPNLKKSNLGMMLEDMINETNEYYLNADIAVIHKKPTPVQIVKVDYPNREHAVITEAYYKTPSTTDYNGIYKGKYIDFEAKESNSKTSFPLSNIHAHQITHLNNIIKHGGIGFFIIYFKVYDEAYLVSFDLVNKYWENQKEERKSIPYSDIKENGELLTISYKPRLDYLKAIDKLYF